METRGFPHWCDASTVSAARRDSVSRYVLDDDPTELEDYADYALGCNPLEGFLLYVLRDAEDRGIYDRWVGGHVESRFENILRSLRSRNQMEDHRILAALNHLQEMGLVFREEETARWIPTALTALHRLSAPELGETTK